MSILDNPVSRGKLWGPSYTWKEAIDGTVKIANSGMGRFIVNGDGIWMEGDGSRNVSRKTRLPRGAEDYALQAIASAGLAQSAIDTSYYVGASYAPEMKIGDTDLAERLKEKGFLVGHRDPGRNQAFEGRYMVAEQLEAGASYPTETAGEDWCIVGDDIDHLILETAQFFEIEVDKGDAPSI